MKCFCRDAGTRLERRLPPCRAGPKSSGAVAQGSALPRGDNPVQRFLKDTRTRGLWQGFPFMTHQTLALCSGLDSAGIRLNQPHEARLPAVPSWCAASIATQGCLEAINAWPPTSGGILLESSSDKTRNGDKRSTAFPPLTMEGKNCCITQSDLAGAVASRPQEP